MNPSWDLCNRALGLLALLGAPLVHLLYDDRYLAAGAIVTAVALVQMPTVIGMTYDQSALAAGDGRGYFTLIAIRAGAQTVAFLLGAHFGGIGGALLGQGVAAALVHPLIIRLARKHGVWDARHDLTMAALVLLLIGGVAQVYGPALAALAQ